MSLAELQPGDRVRAATDILNDGSHPDVPEAACIAQTDSLGVIVRIGHLEEEPERTLYLVRFEDDTKTLGPPVGCWAEELRVDAD